MINKRYIGYAKILLIIIMGFFYVKLVIADLTCSISTTSSCSGSDIVLLRFENDVEGYENSHAQLANYSGNSYNNTLCCGSANNPGFNNTCGTSFLRLSNNTNAHVQDPSNSTYSYPACFYSSISTLCGTYSNNCPSTYTCMLSIASDKGNNATNAHVGSCNKYQTKVCCKIETPSSSGSSSGGGGSGGGGGGGTITADIEIIHPGVISITEKDTIITPISIRNDGQAVLNGITLSAKTNTTDLEVQLDKTFVQQLLIGQEEQALLTIRGGNVLNATQYEITLTAKVTSPAITDSAKLIISFLGGSGKKVETQKQIEFAKKFFESNPECLELKELLTQAEEAVKQQQYEQALKLSDAAIQSCKDLLTSQGKTAQAPRQLRVNEIVLLIIETIAFIFVSYGIYYYYKRRKIINMR